MRSVVGHLQRQRESLASASKSTFPDDAFIRPALPSPMASTPAVLLVLASLVCNFIFARWRERELIALRPGCNPTYTLHANADASSYTCLNLSNDVNNCGYAGHTCAPSCKFLLEPNWRGSKVTDRASQTTESERRRASTARAPSRAPGARTLTALEPAGCKPNPLCFPLGLILTPLPARAHKLASVSRL